ncbi:MAG: monothiol glutaredoxin, Grx4 family [Alphaproteobacteria bacterium]|nr:monothiol glutaredoxin, Grx4 family [Alphaproteobacteria bacterium]MBO4644071.1 monothiol glutaredoxin, Grx4 family [Alphaproteobacteria bacterium]
MTKNEALVRIQHELKDNHIVLFMKGTPANPKCAFSADASKRLREAGINYKSVDVLSDPALYDGIRQYTNYTHFPQMFVDGKFIGSNDNIGKYTAKNKF